MYGNMISYCVIHSSFKFYCYCDSVDLIDLIAEECDPQT